MVHLLSCGSGELTQSGSRVLVIERNFNAYFYAVVKEGCDPSQIAEAIMNANPSSIVKAEVEES